MKPLTLTLGLLAILAAANAAATSHSLLPAGSDDMVPGHLQALPPAGALIARDAPRPHAERLPVSVSWALPGDSAINPVPQPFARASREYWMDVSATELQRGIALPLSAPGAIIRLSPSDTTGGRLAPSGIRVRIGGQSFAGDRAASQVGDVSALRASGMDVPDASLVMQLRPELGAGAATLSAAGASGRYVVHVFEPRSSLTVTAHADRDVALLGEPVKVTVALRDGDRALPLQAVGGFLRAPDGQTTVLHYGTGTHGDFEVTALPLHASRTPGLWELHSFTLSDDGRGNAVRRDTTSVFAVAVPDARLDGTADTRAARDRGIDVTLGLATASASRYAVSGVLYGRDASGRMVPGAYAQSAAWMPSGRGALVLHFDRSSVAGIGAPYELRDLRLQDQLAISLLEHRALALRFDQP